MTGEKQLPVQRKLIFGKSACVLIFEAENRHDDRTTCVDESSADSDKRLDLGNETRK
jgi:hypothetical protein